MKLVIFLISLFIVAAYSQPGDLEWKGCMVEVGVSKDEIKPTDFGDPKSRCVLACAFKKEGIVKDGKVVFDVVFDQAKGGPINDKDLEEEINSCMETAHQETNECDVSYVFLECMSTHNGKKAAN